MKKIRKRKEDVKKRMLRMKRFKKHNPGKKKEKKKFRPTTYYV